MDLEDKEAQAALERIREQYGTGSNSPNSERDPDYRETASGGDGSGQSEIGETGREAGTPGPGVGGLNSWLRRNRGPFGDGYAGAGGDGQSERGNPGISARGGAGSGESAASSDNLEKPHGIRALPSANEQAERTGGKPENGDEVRRIVRITKSGKTQVQLKNGLFKWFDSPPGQVVDADPPVNAFTGQLVTESFEPAPQEIPVRNIPPKESGKGTKTIPIPVPGGTVKDGKFSTQNFAEAIKDHIPKPLVVAKGIMSKKEADESRDTLADAIYEGFKVMDKLIQGTTKGHPQVQIWSNITNMELYTLADSWLARAQVSAKDAMRVRQLIALKRQFQVGAILLPRFAKTWQAYTDWGFEMPGVSSRRRKVKQIRR